MADRDARSMLRTRWTGGRAYSRASEREDAIPSGPAVLYTRRKARRPQAALVRPALSATKWLRIGSFALFVSATNRLHMNNRIEKQIQLNAPVPRVWRAITDHQEFGQWFQVKLDSPFVPGQVSRGHITYPGYEHVKWEATVQKMEPERLFSFTWHPYAIDPNVDYSKEPTTLVEFKLEPKGGGTLLSLTESGFDAIPKDRQFEAFRKNDEGWTEQMTNIEQHVQHSA
jgi:uncharacterized protein YndB with AHSA1/START domain